MAHVDTHAHVWGSPEEHPWEATSPRGAERLVYTIDDYRSDMNDLDVDQAILVATPIHGPGSPYVSDHADGDTFYGIVLVDVDGSNHGGQVREALSSDGVVGVRLNRDEVDRVSSEFWTAMNELGAQLHLLITPEHFSTVAQRAEQYPDITFVIDHLGLPDLDRAPTSAPYDTMADIATYDNTYVKLTVGPVAGDERYPFPSLHRHVRYLLETFGADRLLWGSEYIYQFKNVLPWQTVEFLEAMAFMSDRERRQILDSTARTLLE
jgi:L-fuconolactonase